MLTAIFNDNWKSGKSNTNLRIANLLKSNNNLDKTFTTSFGQSPVNTTLEIIGSALDQRFLFSKLLPSVQSTTVHTRFASHVKD